MAISLARVIIVKFSQYFGHFITSQVMSSKSPADFTCLPESVSLPPRPEKRSRILPLELRGNSGNSTIQQAAVLAHVLTVFCLSIKQFAKLHIGFDLALAHRAENFEHLLGAGEVVAYLSIVADVDKEVRLERVDGFVAAGLDTLLEAIDCTRLDGLKFGMGRHNSMEAERRVGYPLILYPIAR